MVHFISLKLKQKKFNVPNELNDLIKDYIEERKTGKLLFNNILFSAVELRHYYSTYINQLIKNCIFS